jgi:hypothetical protein
MNWAGELVGSEGNAKVEALSMVPLTSDLIPFSFCIRFVPTGWAASMEYLPLGSTRILALPFLSLLIRIFHV